jgi:hypothetical protein
MANDVARWKRWVDDMEEDEFEISARLEAARVALAAAQWEEWSSCNLDHKRTAVIQAILRGEGPSGQKE